MGMAINVKDKKRGVLRIHCGATLTSQGENEGKFHGRLPSAVLATNHAGK
jgi:hypothetical protein